MRQEGSGNHGKGRLTTGQGYSETLQEKVSWETWCKGFREADEQKEQHKSGISQMPEMVITSHWGTVGEAG